MKSKEFVYIENDAYYLTDKGIIASKINEAHSLVMADLIHNRVLDKLSINELTCFFSCFTKINIVTFLLSVFVSKSDDLIARTLNHLKYPNQKKGLMSYFTRLFFS